MSKGPIAAAAEWEAPDVPAMLDRSRPARGPGWALVAGAGVFGAALFLLVKGSLTDDAYITLSYAKNLALYGEWGLIPGEQANSATSPLNVLLLAAVTLLTRVLGEPRPVLALGVVTVLTAGAFGWGWVRVTSALRTPTWIGGLGILVVLVNPFLLSAIGLEVLLIPAAMIWLAAAALEGRPITFGVIAGLAVLVRLDLVLFVLVVAVSARAIRRQVPRALLAAVVVAGPWYVFSWFALGSAVPDTLVIKQLQGDLFGQWGFFTGPVMYFMDRSVVVLLAFGPALIGLVALVAWVALRYAARWESFPPLGPIAALGGGGVVYYAVYSQLGVGPYHWYYVTPMVSLGMFAVVAIGVWLAHTGEHDRLRIGPPATAIALIGLLVAGAAAVDLKQGVPWRSPVIFGNWASSEDYARVGLEIGHQLDGAATLSPGEIGTLAYYCDCAIVDEFSDRGRVVDKVQRRIAEAGPATGLGLKINYYWFDYAQEPRPVQYRLLYDAGPGRGPGVWQVFSEAKGVGHFTLVTAN